MYKYVIKIFLSKILLLLLTLFIAGVPMSLAMLSMNVSFNAPKIYGDYFEEHSYFKQITVYNKISHSAINSNNRKLETAVVDAVNIDDTMLKNIDIAYTDSSKFLLDSDIESGFKVYGEDILKEKSAVLSYDLASFFSETPQNLINKEISVVLNGESEKFFITGIMDGELSQLVNGYAYPNIILHKNELKAPNMITFEVEDFNKVKESVSKLKGAECFSFEKNITDTYFASRAFMVIIFIVAIIFSIIVLAIIKLFHGLIISDKVKSFKMLNVLGLDRKTLGRILAIYSLFFGISIFLVGLLFSLVFAGYINSFVDWQLLLNIDFNIGKTNFWGCCCALVIALAVNLVESFYMSKRINELDISDINAHTW